MKSTNYEDFLPLIPACGTFAVDEDTSKMRKELVKKIKNGQKVFVTPTGTLVDPNSLEAIQPNGKKIVILEGKLASGYYWYERDPHLLDAEKMAMYESFRHFKLDKLNDGRLYWIGTFIPCGEDNIKWTLMAVYDHDHPNNSTSSVKVYSIDPDLDELRSKFGILPHTLTDGVGNPYMCTARKEDVEAGIVVTSASASLRWAAKWTFAVTMWLKKELGYEVFDHTF